MSKPTPTTRADYAHLSTITTRWMDNDVYGHVNNVTYYSYFDTAVNRYLIEAGVLDIHAGAVIGLVIETHCNYFASLAFPKDVQAGIRVAHMGRSSVRYEIGLFATEEYLSRHRPIRDLADLENHVIAWYSDDPMAGIPEYETLRTKLPTSIRLQSNSLNVHEQAALAGVGLAAMPTYTAGRHDELVRVLPEEMSFHGSYWTVLPTAQLRWQVTDRVMAFLHDAVRDAGLTVPGD